MRAGTSILLRVENINTYYGLSHILQGVSLQVNRDEIVTLVGRNGAGKTTTLKSILGIVPVRSGDILFNEQNIGRLPTHVIVQRGISYVPEERRIIPGLSVRENIRIALLKSKNRHREGEMIERVVAKTHGNLTQAAGDLGISRPTLYDLMEKLGLGKK